MNASTGGGWSPVFYPPVLLLYTTPPSERLKCRQYSTSLTSLLLPPASHNWTAWQAVAEIYNFRSAEERKKYIYFFMYFNIFLSPEIKKKFISQPSVILVAFTVNQGLLSLRNVLFSSCIRYGLQAPSTYKTGILESRPQFLFPLLEHHRGFYRKVGILLE